jgi:hypothetical protein
MTDASFHHSDEEMDTTPALANELWVKWVRAL